MSSSVTDKDKLFGDRKIPKMEMLRRLNVYLRPELKSLLLAFVFVIINVALNIILPLFMSEFTNSLNKAGVTLGWILTIAIGYFLVALVSIIFQYVESIILQRAGQRIVYNMRMDVFKHIESMSLNQFNIMPVGSLVTRVANYTSSVSDLFTTVLVRIISNILTIVGVYSIMIYLSPMLSLVLSSVVIVVFLVSFFFSKYITKVFRKERQYLSELNTYLNENLSGMKIIQIFNRQEFKNKEFLEKNEHLRKARYGVTLAFGIFRPLLALLFVVAQGLTLMLGVEFKLNSGEIVAFYLYLSTFFNPIQSLADQLNQVQRALTACERLFNLLDVSPEVLDLPDAIEVDSFKGKIEFKNVWFAYNDEEWILKDVSFVVNPMETVAFVGATGAGKTTILSLIVRNFEIQKGQILIDGIDIKHIKIESLRKGIGQMLQDVFLFSGSIKNNITLNDEKYSDEEIMKACEYVNATTFINKLNKGIESEVTEKGENFSSGQRQLLSFARTVLHKPQMLILDEATANIDTETEAIIQDSLEKMKNIGTMLVVAHRLSTIQHADNIIVLQNGEVIESGNHQALLKKRGHYYKLYQLQFEER